MFNKIIPTKILNLFDLIRLNKPIGFMLLMWPSWFALAYIPISSLELIIWYIYFFVGAFLMRSAGCIINDLVDIKIDNKILRTADRPLTSKKITKTESIIFLLFLLFLSLIILLQFKLNSILIGLTSIPLVILYPFLKRYTYWPQLGLGIVFSWGILIVSFQFLDQITYEFFLLYIGCIFWTLAYDTIYAYQDIEDDIKINIKSTAVLFKNNGRVFVKFFYSLFLLFIGLLAFYSSKSFLSFIVIIPIIIGMNVYLNKWKLESKESCYYFFNFNNLIGLFCFIFLLIF
tara:strand:+ start:724 stop:1587 length:864 start_codon:yes stop_codon:yes gene_type:complete